MGLRACDCVALNDCTRVANDTGANAYYSFPRAMQITGLVPEFQYGVGYFFPLSLKFSAK
jgi:hypothetical protein